VKKVSKKKPVSTKKAVGGKQAKSSKKAGSKSARVFEATDAFGWGLGDPPVSRCEVVDTVKLTDEKWLNLFARTIRRDGRDHRWLFASRKPKPATVVAGGVKPDAVLIVPILVGGPEPLLVATREWRVPIAAYEWGVPAGLIDGDESPEEAAGRELWEETGFEMVGVSRVSPINYSSTGMTDECVQMVYCTCKQPKGHKQHLDGAEDIQVRLLTIADVGRLVDSEEPINARAWLTFYMYHRLGKLE